MWSKTASVWLTGPHRVNKNLWSKYFRGLVKCDTVLWSPFNVSAWFSNWYFRAQPLIGWWSWRVIPIDLSATDLAFIWKLFSSYDSLSTRNPRSFFPSIQQSDVEQQFQVKISAVVRSADLMLCEIYQMFDIKLHFLFSENKFVTKPVWFRQLPTVSDRVQTSTRPKVRLWFSSLEIISSSLIWTWL